ncbi:hypothetical protein I4Q36_05150 [Tuanshanicoccus lijuaniae]|uniref:hypothetical protein n=1 Tax=Aerococcaceae bacterium zg-1292 TaxID=2774330 RepID=UPI001936F39E|nr:hypothetical protein [Aerococcaceae bacterium zg-1292]QQA38059.1 hypothetical protein I4Q36_05150 [Aerococcaceae bacterium zg-1292]
MSYLTINNHVLPLPDQYRISLTDIESKSSGQTEGGTYQRDVIRLGRVSIDVSFTLTRETNVKLTGLLNRSKVLCQYLDPKTNHLTQSEMMMSNYDATMIKNRQGQGLWQVSFTLTEL